MKSLRAGLKACLPMAALAVGMLVPGACSSDLEPEPEVAEAPTRHLGLWESVKRSHTGMGDAIELEGNGSTRRFRVNMSDAHYHIEGDSLVFDAIISDGVEIDSGDIPRVAMAFSIAHDTLIRRLPANTYWLERLASERVEDNPIVGTWRVRRSTHSLTVHKFEQYGADGIVHERTPGVMDTGFYTISNDTLFLNYDDKPKKQIHYEINGDTLSIANFRISRDSLSDSLLPYRFSHYVRVGDKAWYYLGE